MKLFCAEVLKTDPRDVAESEALCNSLRDSLNTHLKNAWGDNFELKVHLVKMQTSTTNMPFLVDNRKTERNYVTKEEK